MKTIPSSVDKYNKEEGFALISVLLVLLVLTLIGIAGTKTTTFELKISSNEKQANQIFYVADSGWKQSGPFLNAWAKKPPAINNTVRTGDPGIDFTDQYYNLVRNFGEGGDTVLNEDFPEDTEDGRIRDIPYWYRIEDQHFDTLAVGFSQDFRDFWYITRCVANRTTTLDVGVSKVYQQ
jgi:hypothetical protein